MIAESHNVEEEPGDEATNDEEDHGEESETEDIENGNEVNEPNPSEAWRNVTTIRSMGIEEQDQRNVAGCLNAKLAIP